MEESKYDSVNEDEFSEWLPNSVQMQQREDEQTVRVPGRSRGRPAVPLCWTRVISVSHDDLTAIRVYPINTDKLVAEGLPVVPRKRRELPWTPYFFPKDYVQAHKDMTFENYRLSERQLLKHGEHVTKERRKIRERALEFDKVDAEKVADDLQVVSKLAKKADKGYFSRRSLRDEVLQDDFEEPVPPKLRRRGRRRPAMTLDEKVEIVHQVFVEHQKVAEVARAYGVSSPQVQ